MAYQYYKDDRDGSETFEADDFYVCLTDAIVGDRFVLRSMSNEVGVFCRGWKHNWLIPGDDFYQEIQAGNNWRAFCAINRTDNNITITGSFFNTTGNIAIPEHMVQPVTEAMLRRGLVLPMVDQYADRDPLSTLLLAPR